MSRECRLSVIIPAFNEEHRLGATLESIHKFLQTKDFSYEIIVVDDGSQDATSAVATRSIEQMPGLQLIRLTENVGKGHAVKRGVEQANGQYILMTDADSSTRIEELDQLFLALQTTNDIAIGSRYLKNGVSPEIRQPVYRVFIGRLGNLLIRWLLIEGIADTQCGFKLFTADSAKNIFQLQRIQRWGFDMEVLALAKMLKYKTVEVPVAWMDSPHSRLRPIRDTVKTFFELLTIKRNMLTGSYQEAVDIKTYLHGSRQQIAKFLVVGTSSALLDLGLLVLLKEVAQVKAFMAVALNQVVVIAYNFLLNKYWSFGSKTAHVKQLGRYLALVGGNYLASIGLMYVFHEVLGIHYVIVRVASILTLMTVNFLFYKHWVYKEA